MWFLLLLPALLGAQGPGWTSPREYENVKLAFEYKLDQWAEAAVCLRTTTTGRPVQQGVAIFLAHDFHQKPGVYTTGAIAGRIPPLQLLPPGFGVWHKVEVLLDGLELEVRIDGELLQYARLGPEYAGKGFIHFADLHHHYEIRNFKVEELPPASTYITSWGPFSLRGEGGEWKLEGDALRGANGHGIQYASPVLEDFVFEAEVRAPNRTNAGVFFRGSPKEGQDRGFEVQIYSPLDSVFPTGSIYGLVRSTLAADLDCCWFHLQVLVQGTLCKVWVNGVLVAESSDISQRRGQIGFQIHSSQGEVEFRRIRAWKL
jgi:hypothetical protein